MLHDTPESKGLPPVEALAHEKPAGLGQTSRSKEIQKQVLRTPAVWILAAASAFMYISRYAINGWGVLFLQEVEGLLADVEAISGGLDQRAAGHSSARCFSGWLSDKLLQGRPEGSGASIFGVLNAVGAVRCSSIRRQRHAGSTCCRMVLFGIAIGVLICFLGGLMAVDIVPREGYRRGPGRRGDDFLYRLRALQDVASGWLIDSNITVAADGVKHYDFGPVAIFWLAAAVISFLLPLLNRGKVKEF